MSHRELTDAYDTRCAAPPVFVTGCARSGTTLLRLMLNSHPELAVPQESHFIYQVACLRARGKWPRRIQSDADWMRLMAFLRAHPYVAKWGLPWETIEARLNRLEHH